MNTITQTHNNHSTFNGRLVAKRAAITVWCMSMLTLVIGAPTAYGVWMASTGGGMEAAAMAGRTSIGETPWYFIAAWAVPILLGFIAAFVIQDADEDNYYDDSGTLYICGMIVVGLLTGLIVFFMNMAMPTSLNVDDTRTPAMVQRVGNTGHTQLVRINQDNVLDWPRLVAIKDGTCKFIVPDGARGYSVRICRVDHAYSFARSSADKPLPDKPAAAAKS